MERLSDIVDHFAEDARSGRLRGLALCKFTLNETTQNLLEVVEKHVIPTGLFLLF